MINLKNLIICKNSEAVSKFCFVICMINLSILFTVNYELIVLFTVNSDLFTVNSEQSEESHSVQWDSSLRSRDFHFVQRDSLLRSE
jgi:hypothetical protein